MPFEPGQSGNPGGRPKKKIFADALRLQVLRPLEFDEEGNQKLPTLPDKPRQIDAIVNALIVESRIGKNLTQAAKEIRDTLDGKPAQAIEHSGMIATTHEELLKQIDSADDTDGEVDTAPSAE